MRVVMRNVMKALFQTDSSFLKLVTETFDRVSAITNYRKVLTINIVLLVEYHGQPQQHRTQQHPVLLHIYAAAEDVCSG